MALLPYQGMQQLLPASKHAPFNPALKCAWAPIKAAETSSKQRMHECLKALCKADRRMTEIAAISQQVSLQAEYGPSSPQGNAERCHLLCAAGDPVTPQHQASPEDGDGQTQPLAGDQCLCSRSARRVTVPPCESEIRRSCNSAAGPKQAPVPYVCCGRCCCHVHSLRA